MRQNGRLYVLAHIAETLSPEMVTRELSRRIRAGTLPSKLSPGSPTCTHLRAVADFWMSTSDFLAKSMVLDWLTILISVLTKLDRRQIPIDEALVAHLSIMVKIANAELVRTTGVSQRPIDRCSTAEADLELNIQVSDVVNAELTLPSVGVSVCLDGEAFKTVCALILLGKPFDLADQPIKRDASVRLVIASGPSTRVECNGQGGCDVRVFCYLWLARTALVLCQDRFVALQKMVTAILNEPRIAKRFLGDEALFLF